MYLSEQEKIDDKQMTKLLNEFEFVLPVEKLFSKPKESITAVHGCVKTSCWADPENQQNL